MPFLPFMRRSSSKNGKNRAGQTVRVSARNGGKAGHEQRQTEKRHSFWNDLDMAEFHQQCPTANPKEEVVSTTDTRGRRRQGSAGHRHRQYSSSSSTAVTSSRQDSGPSDLDGFFAPVTEKELNAIKNDQLHLNRRPRRKVTFAAGGTQALNSKPSEQTSQQDKE